MKLTNEHALYWLQHKCPMPRWERERQKGPYPAKPISVHSLINRQIPHYDHRLEAYNLLNSLKHEVGRGVAIVDYLECFEENWGAHPQYPRRAAYARKWALRIWEQRVKKIEAK